MARPYVKIEFWPTAYNKLTQETNPFIDNKLFRKPACHTSDCWLIQSQTAISNNNLGSIPCGQTAGFTAEASVSISSQGTKIPQNARPKKPQTDPQTHNVTKGKTNRRTQKKQPRRLHSNFCNGRPQMTRIGLKTASPIFVPLPAEGQSEKAKYVPLTVHGRDPAVISPPPAFLGPQPQEHTWSLSILYHQVSYFPACLCILAKMPGTVAEQVLIQVLNK